MTKEERAKLIAKGDHNYVEEMIKAGEVYRCRRCLSIIGTEDEWQDWEYIKNPPKTICFSCWDKAQEAKKARSNA